MPIERRQFDNEQDTLTLHVLDFLQKNQNYAFTSGEIAIRLNEDPLDMIVLLNRLSDSEDILERKMVDGEYYYAIKKIITRLLESLF